MPSKYQETIELRKGVIRYYYVIIASNGEITATSQKYYKLTNARRAAKRVSRLLDAKYSER